MVAGVELTKIDTGCSHAEASRAERKAHIRSFARSLARLVSGERRHSQSDDHMQTCSTGQYKIDTSAQLYYSAIQLYIATVDVYYE